METAQRLARRSFGVGDVPLWGKLKAPIEQMETAQRLARRSFGVGDVPLWGKLKAPIEQMETAQRLARRSFGGGGVPLVHKLTQDAAQVYGLNACDNIDPRSRKLGNPSWACTPNTFSPN